METDRRATAALAFYTPLGCQGDACRDAPTRAVTSWAITCVAPDIDTTLTSKQVLLETLGPEVKSTV